MKNITCGIAAGIIATLTVASGVQGDDYHFGDWTVVVQPAMTSAAAVASRPGPGIVNARAVSASAPTEEIVPGVAPRTIEPVSAVAELKPVPAVALPVIAPGPVAPTPVFLATCPEAPVPATPQIQVNTPVMIQIQSNGGWDDDYPSYRNGLSGLYSSPAYGPWRPYWYGGLRIHRSF